MRRWTSTRLIADSQPYYGRGSDERTRSPSAITRAYPDLLGLRPLPTTTTNIPTLDRSVISLSLAYSWTIYLRSTSAAAPNRLI